MVLLHKQFYLQLLVLHKLYLEELEKSFAEKKVELTQLIQKYPLTSVAVAAGIGFLIGKIFSQKR